MDDTALLNMVAEILEVEASELALTDELDALGWDSLANISFIADVDTATGVTIDADKLADARTIADLHALVNTGV
ncbi:acyl carrier protein [Microbacterium lacus]|uniref:acyl carrier protein n=1 Tax=Microbacterium lacus TaxID=415217 RepID=UPI00384E671C